jgi:hypothetical protein
VLGAASGVTILQALRCGVAQAGYRHRRDQREQVCVQRRLACSVGDSPTGVKVRDLVAWVAFVEETKRMKPTDQAIVRMVSESLGRNVSEPVGGLENTLAPEAEPRACWAKAA